MEAETLPSQSLGDGTGLPGDCVSKRWLSSGSLRKPLLGWRRNTIISKAQRRNLSCKLFLANTKKGRAETHGWVLAATDGKFSQQLCFLRQAFEWETWYHPRGTALGC